MTAVWVPFDVWLAAAEGARWDKYDDEMTQRMAQYTGTGEDSDPETSRWTYMEQPSKRRKAVQNRS